MEEGEEGGEEEEEEEKDVGRERFPSLSPCPFPGSCSVSEPFDTVPL